MTIVERDKLNKLLSQCIPHGVCFSEWLTANGWSNQLIKSYCDNGWFERLSRGVIYRKGDTPQAFAAIASYKKQLGDGLHIAANSALELHGYMHFVPMGRPRLIVAVHNPYTPQWLTLDNFDRRIVPVYMKTFCDAGIKVNEQGLELPVSSPEQAFAECLQLAPSHNSYMDLFLLMELLTILRPRVVEQVLQRVDNQRVKRMFLYMAEKAGHTWFKAVDVSCVGLTASPLSIETGGTFISKYKMTIPTELAHYE